MKSKGGWRRKKGARGDDVGRNHPSRARAYETCSGNSGSCVLDKKHGGPCSGDSDE